MACTMETMNVLVLSPHPDDEAIGCGGTLHRHQSQGDAVQVIHLSSGERGCPGRPPLPTMALREQEARQAALILGVTRLQFWRQPDGALRITPTLVQRLQRELRLWPAQRLYAPHRNDNHPDHRAAWLLAERLRAANGALGLPMPELWLYEVWTPLQRVNRVVNISAALEVKLAAIRAHRSQVAMLDFAAASSGLARYRGAMLCRGKADYAEAFHVIPASAPAADLQGAADATASR